MGVDEISQERVYEKQNEPGQNPKRYQRLRDEREEMPEKRGDCVSRSKGHVRKGHHSEVGARGTRGRAIAVKSEIASSAENAGEGSSA